MIAINSSFQTEQEFRNNTSVIGYNPVGDGASGLDMFVYSTKPGFLQWRLCILWQCFQAAERSRGQIQGRSWNELFSISWVSLLVQITHFALLPEI